MKVLSYADIMDNGKSVFTCIAQTHKNKLVVKFKGNIRVEFPYDYLGSFIEDLKGKVNKEKLCDIELDFTELNYCNSNGFYALMDIIEIIYKLVNGKVVVHRITNDDWQQDTLPILLDMEEILVSERTIFIEEKK